MINKNRGSEFKHMFSLPSEVHHAMFHWFSNLLFLADGYNGLVHICYLVLPWVFRSAEKM